MPVPFLIEGFLWSGFFIHPPVAGIPRAIPSGADPAGLSITLAGKISQAPGGGNRRHGVSAAVTMA